MTNATTGGGDGAAPVGTGGITAPAPARLLPTRPGWWWGRWPTSDARPGGYDPEVFEVIKDFEDDGQIVFVWDGAHWRLSDIEWLAEVPPPAECAAWAAAGKPSAAVLEALGEYDAARRQIVDLAPVAGHSVAQPGEGPAAVERFKAARDSLNIALGLAQFAAIRAERAAQGSAPAGQEVQP